MTKVEMAKEIIKRELAASKIKLRQIKRRVFDGAVASLCRNESYRELQQLYRMTKHGKEKPTRTRGTD